MTDKPNEYLIPLLKPVDESSSNSDAADDVIFIFLIN